jgi:hypothetical protein
MNVTGLFLERGVKRDLGGIVSVILLGYLLAPFQAYAALKGLLEVKEGGWSRTPKSGRITGTLSKLQLGRRLRQLLGAKRRPRPRPQAQGAGAHFKLLAAGLWPRRWRAGLAYGALTVLLVALLWVGFEARGVTPVAAAPDAFNLHSDMTTMDNTTGASGNQLFDDTGDDFTWDSVLSYPTGDDPGEIASGDYIVTVYHTPLLSAANKKVTLSFTLTYGATTIGTVTNQWKGNDASPTAITVNTTIPYPLLTLDENPAQPLQLQIAFVTASAGQGLTIHLDNGANQTVLNTPIIIVDELGWRLLLLVPLVPALPLLMRVLKNRKARRSGA